MPALALAAVLLVATASSLAAAAPRAEAVQAYSVNFADPDFYSPDPDVQQLALDRALDLNSSYVRIGVGWRGISPERPQDPADPDDPAYHFQRLDQEVAEASDRGLVPVLTVTSAPFWAQGRGRPENARGSWKPDPQDLGRFARALARRFDGTHPDPANSGETLPKVDYYEVWNEVNLATFLLPQWGGKDKRKPKSPDIYRRMLNAFYDNAHAVHPDVEVLATGMSPFGDPPGGRSLSPLRFFRELLCLRGRRALKPIRGCRAPRFDILSDHPISPSTGPRVSAEGSEDVSIADLGKVRRILRTAERKGTLDGGRHPLWVSEYWWETNPPRRNPGTPSPSLQARWIAEAQYLLWKQRIAVAMLFQVADDPLEDAPGHRSWQTGLYYQGGGEKPSLAAARFPVAAERRSKRKVYVWTRAPASGELAFQRRVAGAWRQVAGAQVSAGIPRGKLIGMRGSGRLRAVVDGNTSYVWRQRR